MSRTAFIAAGMAAAVASGLKLVPVDETITLARTETQPEPKVHSHKREIARRLRQERRRLDKLKGSQDDR